MKRDIRTLFKDGLESGKSLPENHLEEFEQKLNNTLTDKPNTFRSIRILKIAVSIALLFALSYALYTKSIIKEPNIASDLEIQVSQIERQYLKQIEDAWQNFLSVTDDQNLIEKYRQKLKMLDQDYVEFSKNFQHNPNNLTSLENLIFNLQTRLQFLEDIVNHIHELNAQNKIYETIIL